MSPARGSICDVLPSVAALLAVPGAPDPLGLRARHGTADRVAVVLVDGLGFHLLPMLADHAPLLASVLGGGTGRLEALNCTFPSTTPTSLVSFGTGTAPGEHGVLGFTVNVPGTDRVLTHIAWSGDPDPREWQPVTTWFERIRRAGLDATAVLPAAFVGSGLTEAAYRGARFCGVGARDSAAERVVAELQAGPGLVFGYTAALDTAAHLHGIASPQWQQAAADVDSFLLTVLAGLPPDALLLVTADHGGLDVAMEGRFDVDSDATLADGVRIIAGEPRVRYLHTRLGAESDVIARWQGVLGENAVVLSRDDAISAGYFGRVSEPHAARVGDVVVICRGQAVVLATAHEPKEVAALVGFHGSDSPAEMAIPLITLERPEGR